MHPQLVVRYEAGLAAAAPPDYETAVSMLRDELPQVWYERYLEACGGAANVVRLETNGFEYLYHYASDPSAPPSDCEDRVVVAFGRSRRSKDKRPKSRIGGFPNGREDTDRGHFMAHASGGGVDINLFHQDRALNQGWRKHAGYRQMERFVAKHTGTFFFSRPLYEDFTARPAEIEFGILRPDMTFWVALFDNR